MPEARQFKTIQLSLETWKILTKIKLEFGKASIEEIVKELVRDAGY